MAKLSIIIPCYFNQQNIPVTMNRLLENEASFPAETEFEYIFVDDGSLDKTYEELMIAKNKYTDKVKIVKLSRNFGAHNASLAGLSYATGQANVILAADMQDPPELLPQMFGRWQQGIPLVMAHRIDREDAWPQKTISNVFHWLIRSTGISYAPPGGADLVLFDQRLRQEVVHMQEKNTHIIYLLMWLGHEFSSIPYVRQRRTIGRSRWTLGKKVKSFIDTWVSFSAFPVKVISGIAALLCVLALLVTLGIAGHSLIQHRLPPAWMLLGGGILLLAAFQMLALAVIGEYLWRTHDAVRKRPPYIVEREDLS